MLRAAIGFLWLLAIVFAVLGVALTFNYGIAEAWPWLKSAVVCGLPGFALRMAARQQRSTIK
jgi:hypothetical protein